ncbi:general stress protein, partial [Arthrobacter sp. H5]|uniref:general stress protein n=1 Tax=Arthrobacter sp. H5 TaxID=1267973 RepID=UPI00056A8B21
MSNVLGRTAPRQESRTLPTGETIGRYSSYLDAQKAVDYLADHKFPVQQVSIIGNDLKTVERVTGRLSYPRVALSSAATGAWFGLFVGLILTLFGGDSSYIPLISSMALGAVFWLLFGVIAYAFQRGKRDFTSTSQVIATSYDVIVEPSVAGEAKRLLQKLPMNGQAQHPGGQGPGHGAVTPPERPQGWNDPYSQGGPGQAGPQTGQVMPPQQQPQQPPTQQPTPEPSGDQADTSEGPRRGQFPDLPDGRPQYGVRVPTASGSEDGESAGDDSASKASDGGSGGQQPRG